MNTEKINQITKKFLFTDSFLCYSSIFNPFIDYNEYYLQFYLARGVRFNFDFARKIYKYYDIESENVLRSISASYIMNNVIDVDLLSKHIPYNFWYPKSPNKDTCVKLLDIDQKYHFYVSVLCILNKWTDVLVLCNFKNKDMLLKRLNICIKLNYSLNLEFCNNFDIFLEDDLFSFLLYDGYCRGCCDFKQESYLEFLEEEVDQNCSNDICFANVSSIENIIYKSNFIIPYFNFKLEDIKYNFSLAHYILSNHTMFTSKECSYALSVYISCGIIDHELISLYGVFYLFSYKVPKLNFLIRLYNECSFLKYNIAVILCVYNSPSLLYDKLDLLPDLDIYSIAEFHNNEYIKQDMLNKHKLHKKWYRHLDFKNSKNITPIEVTLKDKICYGNLLTTSCFT